MLELHTEIEIAASPERVWSILVDFPLYEQWNPFIRFINGSAIVGSSLHMRLRPSGTKAMEFRPTVLAVDYQRELRWRGRVLMPGIFTGEHRFVIHPVTANRVRFEQSERFTGVLIPFFRAGLERDAKRGFVEMNAALKQRAEQVP